MSISIKFPNLRVLMINACKSVLNDPNVHVSTNWNDNLGKNEVRVSYLGSSRYQQLFLSADYSIDIKANTFIEAEDIGYHLANELQDYKDRNIADIEIEQFPIEFGEEGVDAHLRTISVNCIIRPND